MTNKKDYRKIWILLGFLAVLIRFFLSGNPYLTERVYSRGLFPIIRTVIDYTVALSPIPLFYVFFGLVFYVLIKRIIKPRYPQPTFIKKVFNLVYSLIAFLGGLVFFFLMMWGYNYARVPLETQLGLTLNPLNDTELKTELDIMTEEIKQLRLNISTPNDLALTDQLMPKPFETKMRAYITKSLNDLGYPTPGRVRGRKLKPAGILLRISTSGFYLPFVGECNTDAGLHPIQLPFVFAHELAHGYGITDEGSCNFLAYHACINADDPYVKYTGALSYWRYLAIAWKRKNRDSYDAFRNALPQAIIADLDAINKQMDLFPDIFPDLRYKAYDTYLKTQGISEGMSNYSRVILLAHAWRKEVQLKRGNEK